MPVEDAVTPMIRPSTQRASKTAALGKLRSDMVTSKKLSYDSSEGEDEEDDDEDEEAISSPSLDEDVEDLEGY
jgi:hypothetical protein